MKKIFCFILCLITATALCACKKNDEDDTAADSNGVINLQMRTPDTFDVLLTKRETVRDAMLIIYEPLFNVTETFGTESVLADECTLSKDARGVTVKLKKGITWHNGDVFSADDVIYTVNKILENPESGYYDNVKYVTSVTKNNSNEVVFHFDRPYVQFQYAMYFPIEHKGIDSAAQCIGTGPFMVENMDAGFMMLKRFDKWHAEAPSIERVKVVFLRTSQMAQESFSSGKLHAIKADVLDRENFAIKEGMGNIPYPDGVFEFIGFNAEKGIFRDPLLRIAAANAIDREKISDIYGDAVASGFPVMMSSAKFSPSYETTMFNQEYAQEVIFSAGWIDSDYDNKPEKTIGDEKVNLSFEMIVPNDSVRVKAASVIEECLEATGFIVSVEVLDKEEYSKRINEGDYDAFIGGIYEGVPYDLSPLLSSDGINRHGLRTSEMDEAIKRTEKAVTEDAFKQAYSALQSLFTADQPIAGLVFDTSAVITQQNIKGEIKPYPYSPYANISKWRME